MKNQAETIDVEVVLKSLETCVIVEIRDNGIGMPEDKLKEINDSLAIDADIETSNEYGNVGLKNVNSRIKFYYGDEYGISFSHNDPHGLICTMTLGKYAIENLHKIHIEGYE
jgi:two-component system, sensor histidine kinase YesM